MSDLSNAWRRGRGKACRPRQCTLEDLPLLRNMHLRNQFSTPRTSPTMMKEVLSPKGNLPILIWTSSCIPRAHFGPAHTGTIECEAAPSPASQATGQLKIKIESQPLPRSRSCLQIKKESDHGNGTVPAERRTERVGEPRAFWQRKRGRVAMTVRAARKRFEHGGFPLMLTGPSPLFTVCSRPSPWQSPPPALSPSVCRGACPPPPQTPRPCLALALSATRSRYPR